MCVFVRLCIHIRPNSASALFITALVVAKMDVFSNEYSPSLHLTSVQ